MTFTKGGPNPNDKQTKRAVRTAAYHKKYKLSQKVLLVLRKSKSDEFGGGWGIYTPNRKGIIIHKDDIATSHVGFQGERNSQLTSRTHSAPTGGNFGISDGELIRNAIIGSLPAGVDEFEFTASTKLHLQNVTSSISPDRRTGPFVVTWNSLGVFCNSSRGSPKYSSNVTKPLPRQADYVSAIDLKLTTRQARAVAREEKVKGVGGVIDSKQQRLSKRLNTSTNNKCDDLQDFVIQMPMKATRDVRGNEQLLWDYPWRL